MRLVVMGALVALSIVSTSAIAQPKYGPGTSATRDQGRADHRLFGTGLRLWPARQGGGRLFQGAERQGRHQRPQDQFHQPGRRLFAAQGGRECAQAGRERPGRRRVQRAGHAAQHGDPSVHEPEEGAAALHRRRRHDLQRSPAFSLDHGLAAQPPGRGDLLCPAPAEEQTRRQGGGALPERRFRQGPAQRPDHGAGRQGQDDDRRRPEFPGDRSHDRQPDDHPQELGRRHACSCSPMPSRPRRRSARWTTSPGSP